MHSIFIHLFNIFKPMKIIHNPDHLHEAIGVSDFRTEEIKEELELLFDSIKELRKPSEVLEAFLTTAETDDERVYVAYMAGVFIGKYTI
jgi:hypothetical protein